ncbi:MAG: bifunctional adenosylcobinamide kinase/adenosylcobinamide-phosphate guanylyltransferase [Prevotellaceae bacterium]|nr:bifunctional adenosylcobinamide kinase/adenosylcobinamide-phosphate guanylyltransferase [Prevotellaceae bacterium]
MKRIILVTGGQRSGKSEYAERLALSLSPRPLYIATARVRDEEMRLRVERHRQRRAGRWDTLEEPLRLSRCKVEGRVALVDCLTLWAANWLPEDGSLPDVELTLGKLKAELDGFLGQEATFIFVGNETGLGGISANALQRTFTDLVGLLNQHVAHLSDEVWLVVAGIPIKIKG